jgi:hypothetical protein
MYGVQWSEFQCAHETAISTLVDFSRLKGDLEGTYSHL